jgi:hypothetical protein
MTETFAEARLGELAWAKTERVRHASTTVSIPGARILKNRDRLMAELLLRCPNATSVRNGYR